MIVDKVNNQTSVIPMELTSIANLIVARKAYLIIQLIHCVFIYFMLEKEGPLPLLLSGTINSIAIASLLKFELRRPSVYITPYNIYLCSGLFRLGFSSIWLSAALSWEHFELLSFGISKVENIVPGLFILQLGDLLFSIGYFVMDRSVSKGIRITPSLLPKYLLEKALALYAFGWALKIAVVFAPQSLGATVLISTFAVAFTLLGSLFLIEKASSSYAIGGNRLWWFVAIAMIMLDVALGMQSYMKSAAAMAIFPLFVYCITLFRDSKIKLDLVTFRNITFLSLVLGFISLIVFPFWQLRRASYDNLTNTYFLTVSDCLERSISAAIPGTPEFNEFHDFPSQGAWGILGRHCNTVAAAWSFQYVQRNGTINGKMLTDALPALIPRFLWPEKPNYSPGSYISVLMGMAVSADTATTATDSGGMAGGLYLDLGWMGLIVGMFLNGMILAAVTRLFQNYVKLDIFAGVGWVVLYAACSTHFESAMDGNVTLWGMLFVVTIVPFLLFRNRSLDSQIAQNRTAETNLQLKSRWSSS